MVQRAEFDPSLRQHSCPQTIWGAVKGGGPDEAGQRRTLGQPFATTPALVEVFANDRRGLGVELAIEICIQLAFKESAGH